MKENEKRFWDSIGKGYSYADAISIDAARSCIDRNLGDHRIGRRVMYKPSADMGKNRLLQREIENVRCGY